GSNFYGQAGHIPDKAGFFDEDDDDQISVPTLLKSDVAENSFQNVVCNDFANVGLTESGRVFTWGGGILGNSTELFDSNPLPITFFDDIKRTTLKISAKSSLSLSLAVPSSSPAPDTASAELYTWGYLSTSTGWKKALSPVLVTAVLKLDMMKSAERVEAVACGVRGGT
ncbi:hypothetical protein HK097_005743, partial [Rhizophlyctis rosea]